MRQRRQQLAAVGQQALAGRQRALADVVGLGLHQVAAVVGDVQHLAGHHHLAEAGERRGADVVRIEIRVQLPERVAHPLLDRAVRGGRCGSGSGFRRFRLRAGGQADRAQQRGGGESEHGDSREKRLAESRAILAYPGDGTFRVPLRRRTRRTQAKGREAAAGSGRAAHPGLMTRCRTGPGAIAAGAAGRCAVPAVLPADGSIAGDGGIRTRGRYVGARGSTRRGRAFSRPRGSAAGSLLPSLAGLQWLADTPALELRCGLPRWRTQRRPALRMGRRQRHAGRCGWIRARGGAAGRTGALVSAWRGRAFATARATGAQARSLTPSGGGCGAASAGVRGRPGCRSGWWTGNCGPAASAARAGRRHG